MLNTSFSWSRYQCQKQSEHPSVAEYRASECYVIDFADLIETHTNCSCNVQNQKLCVNMQHAKALTSSLAGPLLFFLLNSSGSVKICGNCLMIKDKLQTFSKFVSLNVYGDERSM